MKAISRDSVSQAALAGGMIILLAASARGMLVWRAWRADVDRIAVERLSELKSDERTLAALPLTLDSLEARIERFKSLGTAVFLGDNAEDAAALFNAALAELARTNMVHLHAVETSVDTSGPLHRVRMQLRATTDVTGLAGFLHDIESPTRLLLALGIQPQDITVPDDGVELLNVRATVEGLALIRSSSVPSRP